MCFKIYIKWKHHESKEKNKKQNFIVLFLLSQKIFLHILKTMVVNIFQ